jgi:hypothetical protein
VLPSLFIVLEQGSANFFKEGPGSILRHRGPRGCGKIKDINKIGKHLHKFIYYRNTCIVEYTVIIYDQILGGISEKHEIRFIETKLHVIRV